MTANLPAGMLTARGFSGRNDATSGPFEYKTSDSLLWSGVPVSTLALGTRFRCFDGLVYEVAGQLPEGVAAKREETGEQVTFDGRATVRALGTRPEGGQPNA